MSRTLLPAVLVGLAVMLVRAGAAPAESQQQPVALPDGEGRAIVTSVCVDCHSLANVTRHRETRRTWKRIIGEMMDNGAQLTDRDAQTVIDYLSSRLGKRLKINEATAAEIADSFDISTESATAIVKYRSEHGTFATWKDVAVVPGVDAKRVEQQKDCLEFGGT